MIYRMHIYKQIYFVNVIRPIFLKMIKKYAIFHYVKKRVAPKILYFTAGLSHPVFVVGFNLILYIQYIYIYIYLY